MSAIVKYRCPHLGLESDPATWFAFPAAENHCHLRRSPQAVEPSYQQEFCLSDNYVQCPLLVLQKQTESLQDGPEEQVPARPRRRPAPLMWGALIVVFIGGALFIFGSPLLSRQALTPTPELPTNTATLQPTQMPTATLEPTTTPTATLPSPAVVESTRGTTTVPSTTGPMVLALAFDSYVRAGPDRNFATVAYLSAGTVVTILGRDLDGFWLWVRLDDGRDGWVAITQFPPDTIDIQAIPVAPEIPTPDVTATSGG